MSNYQQHPIALFLVFHFNNDNNDNSDNSDNNDNDDINNSMIT